MIILSRVVVKDSSHSSSSNVEIYFKDNFADLLDIFKAAKVNHVTNMNLDRILIPTFEESQGRLCIPLLKLASPEEASTW